MSAEQHHQSADTIIRAGRIISLAPREIEGPAALCLRDGLIQAVVPEAEISEWFGTDTKVISLVDRVLMPGFVDPHAHSEVATKASHLMVDCRAPQHRDVAAVLETLRANLHRERDGWLVGQANLFFDQKLSDRRFPTRDELDSVSTDIAIAIRAGGHLTILNSRALELSGVDADYETVEYSITGKPSVHRDEEGRPTGVVTEMDKLLPFPELSAVESREALESGIRELFRPAGHPTTPISLRLWSRRWL